FSRNGVHMTSMNISVKTNDNRIAPIFISLKVESTSMGKRIEKSAFCNPNNIRDIIDTKITGENSSPDLKITINPFEPTYILRIIAGITIIQYCDLGSTFTPIILEYSDKI